MIHRFLTLSFLLLVALPIAAKHTPPNRYPNELPGFKFYAKHLAPLRPYVSDRAAIVRAFNSDQGITFDGWRAWALYVGEGGTINGHPWARNIVGLLASVNIKPTERVSMVGLKFPAAFSHSVGGVSEINVTCDIYTDRFGLQYWLHSEDSAFGKKGDLLQIVYGPTKRLERKVMGSS